MAPRGSASERARMQHRVKVYNLAQDGSWEDQGVGHVILQDSATEGGARNLLVVSEGDGGSPLLLSRVLPSNTYQRQGEGTIITWSDPELRNDVAISFQHEEGCEHIWNEIQALRGEAAAAYGAPENGEGSQPQGQQGRQQQMQGMIDEVAMERDASDKQGGAMGGQGEDHIGQGGSFQRVELPELEAGTLEEVARILSDLHPCHREGCAAQIRSTDFLKKLGELFHMLEDLEDEEGLRHVNAVMKALVMLNDMQILEVLFDDSAITDTIGMLEYDPSFPEKQNHRETLRTKMKFKEVIPIRREDVLSKIHQTFKISYIKDMILPIVLDDATFGTLSSIILYNNVEILQALASDPGFFQNLFSKMRAADREGQDWANLVEFVRELCDHTKHLQVHQRHQFFVHLVKLGLFDMTCAILQDESDTLRLKGMDVLMSTLQHDPAMLREFLMHQENKEQKKQGEYLMSTIMDTLLLESHSGLQEQISDVLRMLLDPESLQQTGGAGGKDNKNEFWDVFYQNYFGKVLAVLTPDSNPCTLVLVLDLLCFCVHVHSMWIKYFVLRNKLVDKVARLMQRAEKVVVLAALRLIRACVGLKDEFYHNQITSCDALAPVVEAFLANGERYNMLNSAVLELFEFMKKENLKVLIKYSVERFWGDLCKIEYVQCFKQLKLKHEQNVNNESMRVEGEERTVMAELRLTRLRKRRDGSMDKEEEDYFESEDDDGGDSSVANARGVLMTVGGGGMDLDLGHGQKIPLSPPGEAVGAGGLVRFQEVGPGASSPRMQGTVLLTSPSPLVLNPLVDYDLNDDDSPEQAPRANDVMYTNAENKAANRAGGESKDP